MRNTNRVFEQKGHSLGIPMTNLVTNGDFAQGTSGLVAAGSNISVFANELTMLATAKNGQFTMPNVIFIVGNKYYIVVMMKSTTANAQFSAAGVGSSVIYPSGSGKYEKLSLVWDSTLSEPLKLRIRDTRESGFDNIYIKNVLVINLTATFGAGNEPTAAEMDAMTATWFNGTAYQPVTGYLKSLDRSRFANNATLSGGANWKKVGDQYVLDFTNPTAKATIAKNASINDMTQFTFRCWFYYAGAGYGMFYSKGDQTWGIFKTGNYLRFSVPFSTRSGIWSTPSTLVMGSWYCVELVYSPLLITNNPVIYVNGVSVIVTASTTPIGTVLTNSGSDLLLANITANTNSLNSYMSDIQILNRLSTAAEAKRFYNSSCRRYGLQPIA